METAVINSKRQADFKPLDFKEVKEKISLLNLCREEGFNPRRVNGSYVINCPFHTEDTPSCHIFDERRFTCFGCGAKGSVIDFVLKIKPFLGNCSAKAALYLIDKIGSGNVEEYTQDGENFTQIQNSKKQNDFRTKAQTPALKQLFVDKDRITSNDIESVLAIGDQIFNPAYKDAAEFAVKRGWLQPTVLNGYPLGAMAAGEGKSFLAKEQAVVFPKLIQTRRVAELFGLEKEFEDSGRLLCAGIKKRLLPETQRKWKKMAEKILERKVSDTKVSGNAASDKTKKPFSEPPKWICKTGFVTEIPWEFDANEDSEILVILEGPGDGLRLFNEANCDSAISEKFGRNWHITAVDACHTWNEESIPRRAIAWGNSNYSVGFFDGFKHIIIILDGDAPGRKGADALVRLARRQNPQAVVRNIFLGEKLDICDYFDSGKTMEDLAELIRTTASVK